MIWKILISILLGYAALCAIVFIFQRKLLYMPYQIKLAEQRAIDEGLIYWPSFEVFQGFISQAKLPDAKGTVIVFHGQCHGIGRRCGRQGERNTNIKGCLIVVYL